MNVSTLNGFSVKSHRVGRCQVIELAGELDIATAPVLKAAIDEMSPIPDHIQVDVTELTFIDSTGLRLLLHMSQLVNARIWLKGTSLFIAKVFDLVGVSDFFHFADDPDTAYRLIGAAMA
jgi:anti-sigma B factor antagonist